MHKTLDNLRYLSGVLWHFDRNIFFLAVSECLVGALIPYLTILAPECAIAGILNHKEPFYWISFFLLFGMGGIILHMLEVLLVNGFRARVSAARNGCFGQMLTEKMFHLKYSLLEQPDIQELCFRANFLFWSDNNGMAGVFEGLREMFEGILTLVGLVFILSNFNPFLFLFLGGVVIVNVILLKRARKKEDEIRSQRSRMEHEREYLNLTMRDLVAGKDIRLYGLTGFFTRWYQRVAQQVVKTASIGQKGHTKASLGGAVLALLRDMVVYVCLLMALLQGKILVDDFVLYVGATTCFTETLISVIDGFLAVRQFLSHTNDFRCVMELEEETSGNITCKRSFKEIHLNKVSFRYPGSEAYALKDIDLTIHSGEHIMVVGKNGAGKTTLVKLLTGLYEPELGSITICDEDGGIFDERKRFAFFSVILQKIHQYPFTVWENITFQEKESVDISRLKQSVELAGLTRELKRFPRGGETMLRKDFDPEGITLSRGQAQKLALARTLYKEAPAVILDEPSAALDPLAEQKLYDCFDRMLEGRTCVFISHRLSNVRACDRIVLLEQGRIVGCGSHEQLLKDCPLYVSLWEAQSCPYQEIKEEIAL